MKDHRKTLESMLEDYSTKVKGLSSYIKELNNTAARHGTETEHFEEDLQEAHHNVEYYQSEIGRLEKELGGLPKAKPGNVSKPGTFGTIAKPGLLALALSPIGFLVGALLGSKLKSRRESREN